MSDSILFSVIVPTFNRSASLVKAVESILAQTRPADEIIIVDDGSQEDIAAALAPYRDQITLIRQDNAGVAAARNTGIAAARGVWLTFLDSDDLWQPERLAVLERDLQGSSPDIVAHIGNVIYTGEGYAEDLFSIKGVSFPTTQAERVADPLPLTISGMTLQAAAVRRSAFLQAGRFDETMRMMSDTAFFCQLALLGPFLMSGETLCEIIRLPGDDTAITSLRRTKQLYARQMHVRYLEKLLDKTLSPSQRKLVRQRLSGALFLMAATLHSSDRSGARKLLLRAAILHPVPLKGWLKSILALGLGAQGYRLSQTQPAALDRS